MDNSEVAKNNLEVFISQLRFNNDQTVEINKNDIVVFVGPNNAGKSQSLRDIWELGDKTLTGIVVKNLLIHKEGLIFAKDFMQMISIAKERDNNTIFTGFGFQVYDFQVSDSNLSHLGGSRNVFMSYLQTDNRLVVCRPPEAIDRSGIPLHPIHQIIKYPKYRKTVTNYFKKAFGIPLVPNQHHGKTVPMCLGDIPECSAFHVKDAQDFTEQYTDYLERLPMLHNQGDGMRSFAGILLYLSMDYYRTYLIDEPESFLHPPQATIMGHVIAELLKDNQQAFVSTHSQHFVKGLLEKASDRVKIIRITRDGNNNTFSVLDNDKVRELFQDPLLKYSEVLDGMFYKNVVICESDSDCRFYSIINDYLKEQQGKFSETLFVHSSGKDRMEKIARTLKALNIDFRVVPDIDIMNQDIAFKSLIETCGGTWETFQTDYNVLINGLDNVKNLTGHQLINSIESKLSNILDSELSRSKLEDLKRLLDYKSRWECIKQNGISGAPAGNATRSLHNIVNHLKEIGIFVVPVGELECFVKDVGAHGPQWLNNVLEQHPDLNDEVYNEAKRFVSSWNI